MRYLKEFGSNVKRYNLCIVKRSQTWVGWGEEL
jgi:hypothetical protein